MDEHRGWSLIKRTRLLTTILVLLGQQSPGVTRAAVPPSERQALVDVFESMGGRKWRNGAGAAGRWLVGDPCENGWYGVTCNANDTHVVELYPSQVGSGNALNGEIPPSIGNLSQLQHLVLSNAFTHSGELRGTIPPSFAQLKELRCVYFSHSRLSGSIPPAVSQLTKLQGVFMRDNLFRGALPDVSRWSDLRSVDLDSNKALTGELTGFAKLRKLVVLVVHNMGLSGALPASLCQVFECDAHGNGFQCPLPHNGSKRCCAATCTNSSIESSGSRSNSSSSSSSSRDAKRPARRMLQADPGDTRPYGPGYSCHCHTPPPRKPPMRNADGQ